MSTALIEIGCIVLASVKVIRRELLQLCYQRLYFSLKRSLFPERKNDKRPLGPMRRDSFILGLRYVLTMPGNLGRWPSPRNYAVALIGASVRGPASRCCRRKNDA